MPAILREQAFWAAILVAAYVLFVWKCDFLFV
ncbi:hypothetical protein Psfp_02413 [Pelotomaculum sp. FP]|nr:hypothetical protein Psfp_02413 [Pelotomaculum sp. FP]